MEKFTLTKNHIKLIQAFYVGWQDCETGAPEIDPKRPYGNSDVPADICRVLGRLYLDTPEQDAALLELHRETQTALQIVLSCQTFEPGEFEQYKKYYSRAWRRVTP